MDRRYFCNTAIGGVVTVGILSGCTQQQVDNTSKQIADIIQRVQSGVAQACASIGKVVPTANSVLAVLAAIIGNANGTVNAALVTAAMVTQAIQQIAAVGCPADKVVRSAKTANGVQVEFY